MKKNYSLLYQVTTYGFYLLLFLCFQLTAKGQAPQAIPYQAVARDASGNVLPNTQITFLFQILDQPNAWIPEFQETHTVVTNSLGLFTVNIGQGNIISGSLNGINWASGEHYLHILMTLNSATVSPYATDMGTVRFNSVPYALYATHCSDNQWSLNGVDMINTNTGNIGIGTANPNTKLDVRGDISQGTWLDNFPNRRIGVMDANTHVAGMEIENTTLTGNYSQKLHLLTHHYANGYGRRFTIDEDGRVGIGIETPNNLLHVNGMGQFGNYLKIGTDAAEGYFQNAQDGAYRALQTGGTQGYWFQDYNGANTSMYVGLNGTFKGKVGIGTTTPETSLHINNPGDATTITIGSGNNNYGSTNLTIGTSAAFGGQSEIQSVSSVGTSWGNLLLNKNGGNVGIGVSNPDAPLHLMGSIHLQANNSQGGDAIVFDEAPYAGNGHWITEAYAAGFPPANKLRTYNDRTGITVQTIMDNGNVGIGDFQYWESALAKLDVKGNVKIADGTEGTGKVLTSDANGYASWQNIPATAETDPKVGNLTTNIIPRWDGTTNTLTNGSITDNGTNIGIGTTSPLAKLEVDGNVRIVDGTQGLGKVLTSDANGYATWATPANNGSYVDLTSNQTAAGVKTWSNDALFNTKIGVRTTSSPVGELEVKSPSLGTPVADQQSTGVGTNVLSWQSFTAGMSGKFTSLRLWLSNPIGSSSPTPMTINVYSGEGTSGTLLTTLNTTVAGGSVQYQLFNFPNPPQIVAGNKYTFEVSVPTYYYTWVGLSSSNPYAGGTSNAPGWDFDFITYVAPISDITALSVVNGNVGIRNASPVNALDVSGNISSTGNITSPKFNVTQLWNSVANLPPTATFTSGGGTILLSLSGMGYRTSVGSIGVNIIVDGVNKGTCKGFASATTFQTTLSSNFLVLTGIGAGSHTIQLTAISPTLIDPNSYFSGSVLELPF